MDAVSAAPSPAFYPDAASTAAAQQQQQVMNNIHDLLSQQPQQSQQQPLSPQSADFRELLAEFTANAALSPDSATTAGAYAPTTAQVDLSNAASLVADFAAAQQHHARPPSVAAFAAAAAAAAPPGGLARSYAGASSHAAQGASPGPSRNARDRERSAQEALLEQLGYPTDQFVPSSSASTPTPQYPPPLVNNKDQVTAALLNMEPQTRTHLLNALLQIKNQQQHQQHQQQHANSPASANGVSPRPMIHHHPSPRTDMHSSLSNQPSPLATGHINSPQAFSNGSSPMPRYFPQVPQQQQHQQHSAHLGSQAGSLPGSLVSSPAQSPYLQATQSAPQPPPFASATPTGHVFGSVPLAVQTSTFSQQQQQNQLQDPGHFSLDALRAAGGQPDMNLRGALTGDSYATTVADRSDFGDNDFVFSPLMSPALTPQSVFTAGSSSVPTSTSFVPSTSLVSPADFFSPLSSPAIMPQFQGDPATTHQQRLVLQGLVDQTRALGFDGTSINALLGSPVIQSGQGQVHQSPRLGPSEMNGAQQGTSAGSVRRGASTKKTRPSPLLKPTADAQLRRKKAAAQGGRGTSVSSSSGLRSATNSPFMGPSAPKGVKTSPNGSTSATNTPSPVDLEMAEAPGLMGPPPVPQATATAAPGVQDWMNPATPSMLMNLPSNVSMSSLGGPSQTVVKSSPPEVVGSQPHSPAQTKPSPPSAIKFAPIAPAPARQSQQQIQPKLAPKPAVQPTPKSSLGKAAYAETSSSNTEVPTSKSNGAPKKITGRKGPSPRVQATTKVKPLLADNDVSASVKKGNGDARGDALDVILDGMNGSPDVRRTSHKAAEQKRRDSLKARFEELRVLLPPIALSDNPADRRPGEGNVGGQRANTIDPLNPNKGVSKVALLRRSNEYIGMLQDRITRRDQAIDTLRAKLKQVQQDYGLEEALDEVPGLDLDNIDKEEKAAGTLSFYENLDDDDDDPLVDESRTAPTTARKPTSRRRSSAAAIDTGVLAGTSKANGARRSIRTRGSGGVPTGDDVISDHVSAMDMELE
ncbi:hypothetical protein OIV83_005256 [Microbotryomycetes sp. JL201]|nr:hypothetical protein OIV83_005256 [Microbotryomycetes sp. JL201]